MRKSLSLKNYLLVASCVLAFAATTANASLMPALSCDDMKGARASAIEDAKKKIEEMAAYKDMLSDLDVEAQCLVHLSQAMSQYVGSSGGVLGELSSIMEDRLSKAACEQAKQYAKQAQRNIENKVGEAARETGFDDAARMVMEYERQMQQEVDRQARQRIEDQRKRLEELAKAEQRRNETVGDSGETISSGGQIYDLLSGLF